MAAGIKFTAYRDGGALYPWQSAAQDEFARIPSKPKLVIIEVRQPRNPKHLALYWKRLQIVAATDKFFTDAEDVHEWVKVKLGMFKEYKDWDGRIMIRTRSIGVESMDQIKFAAFFERAMYVLTQRLGVTIEELEKIDQLGGEL